jgi:hypothetical protein
MDNQKWTIHRSWQHRSHKTKKNNKNTTHFAIIILLLLIFQSMFIFNAVFLWEGGLIFLSVNNIKVYYCVMKITVIGNSTSHRKQHKKTTIYNVRIPGFVLGQAQK